MERSQLAQREPRTGRGKWRSPLVDRRGGALDLSPLDALLQTLEAEWHPQQVWLFGSRARGVARAESDWDLLVVVPDDCSADLDPVHTWRMGRRAGVRADIVPFRASAFEEDRHTPNTLPYEARVAGVLVYER